ncbi:MAG TPA: Hpt domain-containing protein [Verrucomicrobiae bacterium]|nr:Hpt domain-containing protein [Verrucomicrobiae bacterium]
MKEHLQEQQQVVLANQSMLDLSTLKTRGFDPVSLWERVGGDMELLRELVAILAEECPGMLTRIETAVAEGNADDLQKSSHKMKGSVLQFSASEAAAFASQLEEMGRTSSLAEAPTVLARLTTEVTLLLEVLNKMVGQGAPE